MSISRTAAAIIDTNVVVAGILTSDERAPTARIVDGMLHARFPFLLSLDLLAEYRAVLLRGRVRRRHGLNEAQVDKILAEIALNAIVVDPAERNDPIPDRGDRHLWGLLADRPRAVLVTGDGALLEDPDWPTRGNVVSPRSFVDARDP